MLNFMRTLWVYNKVIRTLQSVVFSCIVIVCVRPVKPLARQRSAPFTWSKNGDEIWFYCQDAHQRSTNNNEVDCCLIPVWQLSATNRELIDSVGLATKILHVSRSHVILCSTFPQVVIYLDKCEPCQLAVMRLPDGLMGVGWWLLGVDD